MAPTCFSIHCTDRIEEADVQTQTDAFLDRPPTPLFIPAKTGLDVATQIQEGDVSIVMNITSSMMYVVLFLQLFDFDLEVKPILEVLVGKTIEQSLVEVMEEEELANLRAQQVSDMAKHACMHACMCMHVCVRACMHVYMCV